MLLRSFKTLIFWHLIREVYGMEKVTVYCELDWMYKDGSRWSFFHRMFKNSNTPIAELTVDGAWLDLDARKLGTPSDEGDEAISSNG